MRRLKCILSLILCTISVIAFSQVGNKRCKWIVVPNGEFEMDSLSVFPNSIQLNYPKDSSISIQYDINTNKAKLISSNKVDSIHVCFTVLPYKLNRPYFKRDVARYDSNAVYKEDYNYRRFLPDKKEELFSSPGINKNGNISRGISFGNNQNVFVNSVLNLQLEGKLTEDVSITAVISDQNIPFQPDGNTQQLQEFDKVYVMLKSKRGNLIAGDLVMKSKPSSFLKYYRNVQGAQTEVYSQGKDSSIRSITTAGIAISKGKFNTMQFGFGLPDSLSEGVQGPYRLRGPNNERFIIVLANSEKVYLDGQLLKRGWDFDYVINYNQAEITFTNNVLITRYSRVRVEFEYSDKNYSRTIMNFSHYQDYKKVHAFVSYYNEKDNPNNPLVYSLSEQDKQRLSLIGDTLNKAVVSSVDSVAYSQNKNLYKRVVIGAQYAYVYSTSPDSAFFDVRFSEVAIGTGSYILDTIININGSVFKYVGPGNGKFEPVQIIATPKQKQMVAAGASIDLSKTDILFGEAAFSKNDLNLYSAEDSQDDNGFAYKIGYANKGRKIPSWPKYKFLGGIDYEFNDKNFTAIDRFRSTDYERDWSENATLKSENNLLNVAAGIYKNENNKVNYLFTHREKPGDVLGEQQTAVFNQTIGRFQVLSNGFLMNNNRRTERSNWQRLNTNVYYRFKYFVPGVSYTLDHNLVRDTAERIIRTSMYFDEQKVYLRNSDSIKFNYFIDYAVRKDKEVYLNTLQDNSISKTMNIGTGGRINRNHTVNGTFTYRYQDNNMGPTKSKNEETVMGRGEWNADLFNRHVRSEILITSATGRELRKRFIYIPVSTGLGTHVWIDENKDGIQQLNEFVEKVYDSPNEYIKSYSPTDEYLRAYTNNFNYRLDATAPRNWRNSSSKVKSFLSRLSNVSSYVVNKKLLDRNIASRFIPFYNNVPDTAVLSYQNTIRSTMFYNRTSPVYGVELNYSTTDSKQYMVQGFDKKKNEDVGLLTRVNVKRIFNIKVSGVYSTRASSSTYLTNRDYEVEAYKAAPSISLQPKNTIRFTLNFAFTDKMNILANSPKETARLFETGLETKINKLSKRTFTANFKFVSIYASLKGTSPNAPVAYELFEALQPGKNFTWNASWQEKLINGLQLSFNYEGRKAGDNGIIHIGRMQVSALF